MRLLATWVVAAGLVVLGLFAARDALRSDDAPAVSPGARSVDTRLRARPAPAPSIADRSRIAAALRALGAEGVLYLTDSSCRRFLLRVPALAWTTPQGLPGPDCAGGLPPALDERFGLLARQIGANTIEVTAENWRFRFAGNAPAFAPAGTLTFLRNGQLYAWTVRCPPAAETTLFQGLRVLERCPRRVEDAPARLREVLWLSGEEYAAVAGQEFASTLMIVRAGRTTPLFQALGVRMGGLRGEPRGRYIAVRIDENLVVFDTRTGEAVPFPAGTEQPARALAWSPEGPFAAVADERSVRVYRLARPDQAVTLPLAMVGVDWR